MKNKKTIYHFIIDKSGSMHGSETQTIAGFNTNLKTVQDLEIEFKEQKNPNESTSYFTWSFCIIALKE